MSVTFPWGETFSVTAELGFLVRKFTLNQSVLNGDDVLDGTLEGLDISPYAQQIRVARGRTEQIGPFNAGTLQIRLVNNDRRFDPLNQDSPYWDPVAGRSGVVPRRKVTVIADGEPVFVGRIVDVDVEYEPAPAGQDISFCELICADDFQILANTSTETAATPAEELSGARVSYLLDLPEIDYPATRDIDTGISTLGAYQIAANTNALTYLQRIAEAEQGLCFIARNGDLTFLDRAAVSFANPQETFADDGTGISYRTLSIRYGSEQLFNKISVTRQGGAIQTADDLASQTEFGIQSLVFTDSLLATDAQALDLADDLLGLFAQPEYRFDRMTVSLQDKQQADRAAILALDLGDQIRIIRTFASGNPLQVTEIYQIQQISHAVNPVGHTMEFGLAWISLVYPFTLNDPVLGLLDSGNAVT